MASQSRKHRGLRSQKVVADWFRLRGWPFAESTGAGRSGADVTGVPGLRIEVKARRAFTPLQWLRQVRAGAETWRHGVPFVVFRPDGMGEANVGEWGCLLRLDDMTSLLHEAGYGDPSGVANGLDDEKDEHHHEVGAEGDTHERAGDSELPVVPVPTHAPETT